MFRSEVAPLKLLLRTLAVAIAIFVPLEALGLAAAKLLARMALLYDPPRVENYSDYLKRRDPQLGWPSPASFGQGEYDASGSRVVPAFPDTTMASCAALFGDSFTWGDEVAAEHAYGNVLARLLGCRVANYGVPGYGTDQAFLRYEKVGGDAPIVILGHFSENIIRNVNQERGFLTNQVLGLKPRFVLRDRQPVLVPLPQLTLEQYGALRERASELVPNDYFAPGGSAGIRTVSFPYAVSVIGALGHYRIRAAIEGRPSYAQFYDPGHASQALQVTEAIVTRFAARVQMREQKFMVLLLPSPKDLELLRNKGIAPYAELARRLEGAGVVVVDIGEQLLIALGARDPCELYTRCGAGHFIPSANAKLAQIVFENIGALGWLPGRQAE
jgi:hypothetical protein